MMSIFSKVDDFNLKLKRIRELFKKYKINGMLISSQANFTWLTGGRSFISLASEKACAFVFVTVDSSFLLVNSIERPRMLDEELTDLPLVIKEYPWYEEAKRDEIIKTIVNNEVYGIDCDYANDFFELRSVMTQSELARYRRLGFDTAVALEETCLNLKKGMSEYLAAGILSRRLWEIGIEPVTILAGFDDRALNYRHPVPTANALQKYAMLVVCARKYGLIVSCTRLIHFGKPEEEVLNKLKHVSEIDAYLIANTRPGVLIKDLFKGITEMYEKSGFPEEWKKHHQGGLTGYYSREFRASANCDHTVIKDQVYAWNPSIQGVKSEDTILVGAERNEIITNTGNFEYVDVVFNGETIIRPSILII
ncbi:MAG: aminopeptidase P family N-terminal domain-containing protein [Bacillota bacterium]|nr:aminopeptidase P family N-terminal domain-containing protein [Bacillota bacterium]